MWGNTVVSQKSTNPWKTIHPWKTPPSSTFHSVNSLWLVLLPPVVTLVQSTFQRENKITISTNNLLIPYCQLQNSLHTFIHYCNYIIHFPSTYDSMIKLLLNIPNYWVLKYGRDFLALRAQRYWVEALVLWHQSSTHQLNKLTNLPVTLPPFSSHLAVVGTLITLLILGLIIGERVKSPELLFTKGKTANNPYKIWACVCKWNCCQSEF